MNSLVGTCTDFVFIVTESKNNGTPTTLKNISQMYTIKTRDIHSFVTY